MKKYFRSQSGRLKLPFFFPDATRAVVKSVDFEEVEKTRTPGILVNTLHLYQGMDHGVLRKTGGIREFMGWKGGVISDSGGFQVMSLVKGKDKLGEVKDEGVVFKMPNRRKEMLTPEKSIVFQMELKPDMLVVLDDFTEPGAGRKMAEKTVERTINWARRSKIEFERQCKKRGLGKKDRPYLLGVVQGGSFVDLREKCAEELVKIGFDGFGYGGWPLDENNIFDIKMAKVIADKTPKDYLLYGLGIGKPEDIVSCVRLGYDIFDCVLPTRDARHGRLYVWKKGKKLSEKGDFYEYFNPRKGKFKDDLGKIDEVCDCRVCQKYTRAYLHHLFKLKEVGSMSLASIHNLRFYAKLMERLQEGRKR